MVFTVVGSLLGCVLPSRGLPSLMLIQEADDARLIMTDSFLIFWRRGLVDQQFGQRPGLEGQGIGVDQ
jgi:hypothetical protein